MTARLPGILLDTCAVIWLANGDPLTREALDAIESARRAEGVFVSAVSAWEVGLLSRDRPDRGPLLHFLPDPKTWFARLMAEPSVRLAALTPDIAIDAYHLPGSFHGDPADRLIVSTARHHALPILTRDARIIAFGQAGHVEVLPC